MGLHAYVARQMLNSMRRAEHLGIPMRAWNEDYLERLINTINAARTVPYILKLIQRELRLIAVGPGESTADYSLRLGWLDPDEQGGTESAAAILYGQAVETAVYWRLRRRRVWRRRLMPGLLGGRAYVRAVLDLHRARNADADWLAQYALSLEQWRADNEASARRHPCAVAEIFRRWREGNSRVAAAPEPDPGDSTLS